MRHGLKRAMGLFLGLAIATFAGSASAQTPTNVDGTWTGGTTRGATTVTLVLKQDGKKVTGTLSGAGAGVDGPVTGMVEGNKITLQSGFGGTTPALDVKGDQITGKLSTGTLNLTRAKKK